MANAGGTIETVALELSRVLQPLNEELQPGRARVFFAQLGIQLSAAQEASLAPPLSTTVTKTTELIAKTGELITAIDDENTGDIIGFSADLLLIIRDLIDSFIGIKNGLSGIGIPAATAEKIPERLLNYLAVSYLDRVPGVNGALEFFGILEATEFNVGSVDPANPPFTVYSFHLDKIGSWVSDGGNQFKTMYGWGEPTFDGRVLFERIENIVARLGLPVIYDDSGAIPRLDLVLAEIVPATDVNPKGLRFRLKSNLSSGVQTFQQDDWEVKSKIDAVLPVDTALQIQPDGNITLRAPTSTNIQGDFNFKWTGRRTAPPAPFVIIGVAGGSRLEVAEFSVGSGTSLNWDGSQANGEFSFEAAVREAKVIIDTTSGDGFLTKILPAINFESSFDLLIGISSTRGVYFKGSSALELRIPTHIELGPVALEGITIGLKLQDGKIPVSLGVDIKAALGPLVAVVQNIGVTATFSFPPNNSGNLGPLQMDIGFKPPNGVGLSIDAGVVKGGGFLYLDFDKGEYFGALELSFQGIISLKAIGIINTKMPDGSKGFALLILITAEFTPIQLGFGFTLNGVGGLLAVNRSVNVDALRAGVRTGAAASILFPQDIVANITRIISDLKTIFPIVEGHFIIAPMAKIGWGTPTLISLELGIILDIPKPAFVIIGILRCILPTQEAAILKLQVNFAGGIDFDAGLIWFDASIFDSSILVFTLSGDMALRIGWKTPIFVISVGGFHPAFTEIPADLTGMKRIMLALLSGDNPRLNAQIYFAITSNTVQSGARVELYAAAAGFNLYGYLGYDLLIQFSPFHFIAQIYAGLALRRGTSVIAGVSVRCELSGPTPWNANGEASLKILFFTITVGFNETWGEDAPAQPIETVDVLQLMVEALQDDRNWKADIPANTSLTVTLKKIELPDDKIIIHPFGILSASQKVAPLNLEINKFGNKKPVNDTRFQINYAGSREEVKEEFAIANFVTLDDSEKLSRKSFERMSSGLTIKDSNASESGSRIQKEINYELSYVHRKKAIKFGLYKLFSNVFNVLVGGSAISKSEYSVSKQIANNAPAAVAVADSSYTIVNVSNLELHAAGLTAVTEAEAYMMYDDLVKNNPSLKGNIQVVSQFEL